MANVSRGSASLFHDGDEIDEQVYDALFINAHPSDDQCKKEQITTYGNRKILCNDMKVFRSERNPGDYVYYNTHCHLCGKETRISNIHICRKEKYCLNLPRQWMFVLLCWTHLQLKK